MPLPERQRQLLIFLNRAEFEDGGLTVKNGLLTAEGGPLVKWDAGEVRGGEATGRRRR